MPNQRHLLNVLLPEAGHVRLHQVEQLRHHRQHAAEMARPRAAFPTLRGLTRHDPDFRARWVHGVDQRREQQVDPASRGQAPVARQIARILGEVVVRPELERVDEDAEHDRVRPTARFIHQREMPLVEIAHGGHQADPTALGHLDGTPGPERGDVVDVEHRRRAVSQSYALPPGIFPAAPRRRRPLPPRAPRHPVLRTASGTAG